MDQQTLERLVMDRELGELPADAVELLAAYLREHPHDEAACDALGRTLAGARRALRNNRDDTELKVLDESRVHRALRVGDVKAVAGRWRPLAVAAALVMAFFFGIEFSSRPGAATPQSFARFERTQPPTAKRTPEFWAIPQFPTAPPRKAGPAVIWTSPLAKPQLGETS